jgi:uncharacterized protein (DUF433 family)
MKLPKIGQKHNTSSRKDTPASLSLLLERIIINNKILDGKPFLRGTKITVEEVLKLKDKGLSTDEILKIYPKLTKEDIQAVSLFR